MKCFVIFAALAVIGFISATPADNAAIIKSDATAVSNLIKNAEKASVENIYASYIKEITKYKSNIISFTSFLETRLCLLGTAGKQYWVGLSEKINALTDLTNKWGSTQIRAKTNAYLSDYNKQVPKPFETALNAIATKVSKNATCDLMSCYDTNMNMYYSYSLSMIAEQVRYGGMDYMMSPLDMLNTDLKMAHDAPNMALWSPKPEGCTDPNSMMMAFDKACVLSKYEANEPALLAAYSAYCGNATIAWAANLDSSLQMRQWSWTSTSSGWPSNIDMTNQCMTNWTPPPPPMPPMPPM